MLSKRTLIILSIGIVVLLGIFSLYWYSVNSVLDPSKTVTDEYNLILEDFEGNPVSLSSYRKKPLVAFMWASWCTYCEEELRQLTRLKAEFRDAVSVVAINRAEPPPIAKSYIESLEGVRDIVFLLDSSDSFFKSVEGYAMPETIFIHSYGNVFYHHRGPLPYDEAEKQLRLMLSGKVPE